MLTISYGRTVNMGNFESLRIDCSEAIKTENLTTRQIGRARLLLYNICKDFVDAAIATELAAKETEREKIRRKI